MLDNSLDLRRLSLLDEFRTNIDSIFDLDYDQFYNKYPTYERLSVDEVSMLLINNLRNLGTYREYRTGREHLYHAIPDLQIPYVDPVIPMRIGPYCSNNTSRHIIDLIEYFSLWDPINHLLDIMYSKIKRYCRYSEIEQDCPSYSTRSQLNRLTGSVQQQLQTDMIFNGEASLLALAHMNKKNIEHTISKPCNLWELVNTSKRPLRIYITNSFNLHSMKELIHKVLHILRSFEKKIVFYIATFRDIDTELYTILSRSRYVTNVEKLENDILIFELSRT